MGRPPTPTEILKLTGGYRPDRHGDRVDADGLEIAEELNCPDHLDDAARAEWARVTAVLSPLGVATSLDRAALAVYCLSWSRWVEAEGEIAEGGLVVEGHRGVMVPNPLLRVSRDSRDAMLKAAAKLGLTPGDRATLKLPMKFTPETRDISEVLAERAERRERGGIEQFLSPELRK